MQNSISIKLQWFIAIMQIEIVFSQSSHCRQINSTVDQKYFSEYEYVQSNTQDFSNIQNVEYDLIEKVCIDSYKIEGQIIQSIFVQNLSNVTFAICHLVKNSSLFIQCTNLPFPFCRGNFQNVLQSEIQINENEICQNFYYSQLLQQFYVFCKNTFRFSIRIIDAENKRQVSMLQNDEILELSYCSQEVIQISDSSFLLAFLGCKNWRFYYTQNQTITLILDQSSITEKVYPQQFQICQGDLYLTKLMNEQTNKIEQFYYLIQFDSDYQTSQIFKTYLVSEIEIFKIVFNNRCRINYIIYSYQQDLNNLFNNTLNNVYLSSQYKNSTAYVVNELFLIQSSSSLLIIKNEFQNQTYLINNASINFLNIFNSFYQFDLKQEQIIFYQFQMQKLLNKLEKKYFFAFQNKGLFEFNQVMCYEIKMNKFEELQNKNDTSISIQVLNNCQLNGDAQISEFKGITQNNFTFPIESENKYFSINDRINLSEKCFKKLPGLLNNQSYKILSASYQQDQYYLIQILDYILMYKCDSDKFQLKLKIKDFQVYYYQNSFLLIKDDSQIKLFTLVGNQFIEMEQINQGEILQIQQIDYNFIIKYKEQQQFINLNYFQLQSKQYLQNIVFQDQEIYFFYEVSKKFHLVQYQNYFLIQWDDQIFHQDLFDQRIIFLSTLKYGCFILSVSNSKNFLSLYQFNKFELSLVVKKSIKDYEIVRPLIYKSKYETIAIQATQRSQQFILIFSVKSKVSINLIQIIKCQNCDFWLNSNSIYLIDQSQNMYCIQLNIVTLTYKLPESLNNYVTSRISEKFINQLGTATNFQIDLILVNQCFELKPINKEIFLPINSSISFYFEDFFYGPIDAFQFHSTQLKLDFYDSQVKKQSIDYCLKKSLIPICIQQIQFNYLFENKTILQSGIYIYINKLKNEVIIISNQQRLDIFNPFFIFQDEDHYFFLQIISDKAIIFEFKIDVRLEIYLQLSYFELFDSVKDFYLEKIGDLIVFNNIASRQPEIIYYFFKSKFYLQVNIQYTEQIIKIKKLQPNNENNQIEYITVNQLGVCCYYSNFYLLINLYEISNFQLTLNQSFKIYQEDLLKECQKLSIQDYCFILSSYYVNVFEGTLTNQTISIYWLMSENNFAILVKASVEMKNLQKIKLVMQLIRNPNIINLAQAFLFNEILYVKSAYSSYLYNLKQKNNSLFYDYFSNLQTTTIKIIQYNSTHLLLIFQDSFPFQSMFIFQQIKNYLTLDENYFAQYDRNFSFTLIASFGIQQSNISINIQKIKDKQKQKRSVFIINLLFQFIGLLLIIYILFIKKKRNQKITSIEFTKRVIIQNQEKI